MLYFRINSNPDDIKFVTFAMINLNICVRHILDFNYSDNLE